MIKLRAQAGSANDLFRVGSALVNTQVIITLRGQTALYDDFLARVCCSNEAYTVHLLDLQLLSKGAVKSCEELEELYKYCLKFLNAL